MIEKYFCFSSTGYFCKFVVHYYHYPVLPLCFTIVPGVYDDWLKNYLHINSYGKAPLNITVEGERYI